MTSKRKLEIDIYKLWSMPEEKRFEYVESLIAENRALQERVRELERQRWRIASYLETVQMCEECPAYEDCPSTGMLGAGECVDEIIKWGERVAKEGGNE